MPPDQITETERSQRLRKIRDRANASIPGPWRWTGNTAVDRIELSAMHGGGHVIIDSGTYPEELIHDHLDCESYDLEEARERYLIDVALIADQPYESLPTEKLIALALARDLSTQHGREGLIEHLVIWDEDHRCLEPETETKRQARLREFLRPDYDAYEFGPIDYEDHGLHLSRECVVRPDLSFNIKGFLKSYRELARYEVLAGRTVQEHHDAGGELNGEPRNLYREDVVGIASPEAELIAHSRDDIDFLLAEVDRLKAEAGE